MKSYELMTKEKKELLHSSAKIHEYIPTAQL